MNTQNIVLDFTQTKSVDGQPLAVLPVELAKKLLKVYAKTSLEFTTARDIADELIKDLTHERNNNVSQDIVTAITRVANEFVQERELIRLVSAEDWDAFKVEQDMAV